MKKYKHFLGTTKMKDFADRDRPGNKLRRYRRAIREGKQYKSFKGICISNWWHRRNQLHNMLHMQWYVFQNARKMLMVKKWKELFE